MNLHFNAIRAKCDFFNDSGSEAEFYWTWQVYSPDPNSRNVHQGFSFGCELDDGHSFRPGQQLDLTDLKFTVPFDVPSTDGQETHTVVDIFCWESDHSTLETKKLFTNGALAKLWKLYTTNGKRKKAAIDQLVSWLDDSDDGVLVQFLGALSVAGAALPAVAVAKAAVPLIRGAIEVIKSNSDDYIGVNRVEIFAKKTAGNINFRWLMNKGIEKSFHGQQAPSEREMVFRSGDGTTRTHLETFFQVIV